MTRYRLFEAFGVELEYMIVDAETLDVRPICDELFKSMMGDYVSDVDRGELAWSNELAQHVVELKTNGPASTLSGLAKKFQAEVREVESRLEPMGARLLPTAMHPWMDPHLEMMLWQHDSSPIYEAYHRIFDCRGHGWANLQSTHLNFPFAGDEEFARLHSAIRLVLPLLPTLAASSPICDSRFSGWADTRLHVYRSNSQRVPEVAGLVVPEPVATRDEYQSVIFEPMYQAIAPLDPDNLLQDEFLNSRGAIARFERGSIEIRLLDIQECPARDLVIAELVTALLQSLVAERWTSLEDQRAVTTESLAHLLEETAREAERTIVRDTPLLRQFGIEEDSLIARDIWNKLIPELGLTKHQRDLSEGLIQAGTLSTRIAQNLSVKPSREELRDVYRQLADCLRNGKPFPARGL